ncbi:MAG: hypothetical protein PVG22_18680 [Chromatiales bacterium]|jgi:hypothetical protein
MKWLSTSLGLIFSFLSCHASAFVYSVENGLFNQTIDPLAKAESAAAYYNYNSSTASGTPDFGTVSNTGFFWLYEDTTTNILSLGMIFDTQNDGSGGSVVLTTGGMPVTSFVSVEDDNGDIVPTNLINGTESWNWIACCTDGGMVSGLENSSWTITIDLLSSTGINDWYFLDGPDSLTPSQIMLDMNSTLIIKSAIASVSEPNILALLGLGLIGLVLPGSISHRKRMRAHLS